MEIAGRYRSSRIRFKAENDERTVTVRHGADGWTLFGSAFRQNVKVSTDKLEINRMTASLRKKRLPAFR